MYLTKINSKTGLLDIEDVEDGVLAIKAFKEVVDDPSLGLGCMTAIALMVDYLSPIRYYSDADRPRKAMEEVTGDRDKWVWNQEKIQLALKKYDELQYDPVVEEGRLYKDSKVQKLIEYRESEKYYGKKHNLKEADGETEKIFRNPASIREDLRKINSDIAEWEKQTQGKNIYDNTPAKSGYNLSRLEQKLEKKNSFYKQVR